MLRSHIKRKISAGEALSVAIVGGGPSATEFLIRLHEAGGGAWRIEATIFEPRHDLGLGVAWDNETDELLANMRARTLGPSYPEFILIAEILEKLGHSEAGVEYPSRNAVGAALRYRWREACENYFTALWNVRHERTRVLTLQYCDNQAVLGKEDGNEARADIVVLAVGNLWCIRDQALPANALVINGWDPAAFNTLPKDDDILIRGSGLTAIDATIRLLTNGHQRRAGSIVWHSRSGELPYVRPGQIHTITPKYLEYRKIETLIEERRQQGRMLTLKDIYDLYYLEMNAQRTLLKGEFAARSDLGDLYDLVEILGYAKDGRALLERGIAEADEPSLWFSVAKLLDEYIIPMIWNALDPQEQSRFVADVKRRFDRFWAPIPKNNAAKMKEWISSGLVQLVRNPIRELRADENTGRIIFDQSLEDPWGEKKKSELQARYSRGFAAMIEASGIRSDPNSFENVLIKGMESAGLLVPLKCKGPSSTRPIYRGYCVDWRTGAVQDAMGKPHEWLFSLTGSIMVGVHHFTNSYLAVSASADRLATSLFRHGAEVLPPKIDRNTSTGPPSGVDRPLS